MSYMSTKFCEVCDEDYDWAAPECPGCVHRRYAKGLQRNLDQARGELEVIKSRIDELRDWAQSRARYCETVLVQYAVPSRDIPLEPVERRAELRVLNVVLAALDGKEIPWNPAKEIL